MHVIGSRVHCVPGCMCLQRLCNFFFSTFSTLLQLFCNFYATFFATFSTLLQLSLQLFATFPPPPTFCNCFAICFATFLQRFATSWQKKINFFCNLFCNFFCNFLQLHCNFFCKMCVCVCVFSVFTWHPQVFVIWPKTLYYDVYGHGDRNLGKVEGKGSSIWIKIIDN